MRNMRKLAVPAAALMAAAVLVTTLSAFVTESTAGGEGAPRICGLPFTGGIREKVSPVPGGPARAKEMAESVKAAAAAEAERAAREADPFWDRPQIDPESWEFILANPWHDIGGYTPELETLEGQRFDARIIGAMQAFSQAARDEGLSVFLSSGYRSYDEQSYLFRRKAAEYGEETAATIVARPGTSEHQTGLCCDITDRYYERKDRSLEETELYQWMYEHCHEYGFILRFPEGKEDVTGIIYEPWHFRYVGEEAAAYIMEHDLTLEEFLDLYDKE